MRNQVDLAPAPFGSTTASLRSLMLLGGMLSLLASTSWPLAFMHPWREGLIGLLLLLGFFLLYFHRKKSSGPLRLEKYYVGFWLCLTIYTLVCGYFGGKGENVAAYMLLCLLAMACSTLPRGLIWLIQGLIWSAFALLLFMPNHPGTVRWDAVIWLWAGVVAAGMTFHQKHLYQSQIQQQNTLQTILELTEDGICLINASNTLITANPRAQELLGTDALTDPSSALASLLKHIRDERPPSPFLHRLTGPDGSTVACRIAWSTSDAKAHPILVLTLTDISLLRA